VGAWYRDGAPVFADGGWGTPLSGYGGREYPLYSTYSIVLATFLGTMGLPHVLVRFYTNPDGRAARRTTVIVLAMLGGFYLFPPVFGMLGRIYLPSLPTNGQVDSVVLLLPAQMTPGVLGEVMSAVLAGGAFAALLSTASGLTVSVAGVIDQDLFSGLLNRRLGGDLPRTHSFRLASAVAVLVPYAAASLLAPQVTLADTVGLAFAVAASTFCPLLLLGVWWRGLSVTGALAGLTVGAGTAIVAVTTTYFGLVPVDADPWWATLLAQPAAWSMPLAFLTTVLVSRATPGTVPRGAARIMVRLHAPEELTGPRSSAS
jgi:cation/acetate symporter